MVRKYEMISGLAEDTAKQMVQNEEEWKTYLTTAARLYKYPFKEQLLIYAQRPEATACASIEIWNETMHCWVNKGAKGIALLDEENNAGLKYVFDIVDVHKARRIGRFPHLWEMGEEHQNAVLDRLEQTYGETDKDAGFVGRIREIAGWIAGDCYKELASDMEYIKEGSFLEDLNERNIEIRLRETLTDSIAYTVLKRCGMGEEELSEEISFPYIHEFNTVETLSQLGSNVSDLAKPILMEIGKTIRIFDKDRQQQLSSVRTTNETIKEKGLEKSSALDYNALKCESEKQEHESTLQTGETGERSQNDESDIREERGLSDTDVTDGRAAGGNTDEIRTDEKEIFTGTQERNLHGTSSERQAEGTSVDDSGTGRAEDGIFDRTDEIRRGSDRTDQGRKSDDLGAEDEQNQTFSGGNRTDGIDLQLKDEMEEPDSEVLSGLSLSDLEHGILQFDEFMVHKCADIAGYFLFEQDEEKQTEYVKNSYKHKEYAEFYVGKERAGYRADEEGLTVWHGSYLNQSAEATVSWKDVRDRIAYYIENNEYLKPGKVPQWEGEKETYSQLSLFPSFEEQVGNIAAAQASVNHTMPAAFSLPQEQLEAILRTSGGRDNSRKRIYAKYSQGKSPEEIAEFLKNEYAITGKGFDFGDNPVALWFDESGMRIGYGTSANEAFLVDTVERQRVASAIYYFFRDGMEETPESFAVKAYNYPESESHLMELLSTTEGRELIAGEIIKAKEQLDMGEKKLRWNYVKKPEYLLGEIADISTEKREYPTLDNVEVLQEAFITQDEIDDRLTGGSGFTHGRFLIYEYFMEGHDKKGSINFLKKEYGTGGSSHALPGSDSAHEDHDAKGIRLEKGSYSNPYAKVLLNWNVVEKRIRELIKADKYLSSQGKEAYAKYKQEQAEEAMQKEQEKLEHGICKECKEAIETAIVDDFDGYRLQGDTEKAVMEQYGKERVEYVLASTIQHLSYDGRFSENNKEWAKGIVPHAEWNTRDLVVTSHPAVLDGFTNQVRRYQEYDREQTKSERREETETLGENVQKPEVETGQNNDEDLLTQTSHIEFSYVP